VQAICFDLNGTISNDEELYYEIFSELFAREGRPVSRDEYFGRLVGHVDGDLVRLWLGEEYPHVDRMLAERLERFLALAADGRTVSPGVRRAVLAAAEAAPVAIVSGAFRVEVEAILAGAGLDGVASAVVGFEDTPRSKPHPDPYLKALELLGLDASSAVAVEDTAVGIASARAAGIRCVAVLGSQHEDALGGADEIAPKLDEALVARLLGR
jgi:HAD superfamily hydrolase (TIGR01509 family)